MYNDALTGWKVGSTKPFAAPPCFSNASMALAFCSTAALTLTGSGSTNSQSYSTSKRAPLLASARLTLPNATLPFGGIMAVNARLAADLPAPSTAAKFTDPLKFMVNRTTLGAVLVNSYTNASGSFTFVVCRVISSEITVRDFSSLGSSFAPLAGRATAVGRCCSLPRLENCPNDDIARSFVQSFSILVIEMRVCAGVG